MEATHGVIMAESGTMSMVKVTAAAMSTAKVVGGRLTAVGFSVNPVLLVEEPGMA